MRMTAVSLPLVAPLTEEDLVQLLEEAAPRHLALAVRMLGRTEDAQDALQEAWFRAWKARGGLREAAAAHGWVRRILVAECLRTLRRRSLRA